MPKVFRGATPTKKENVLATPPHKIRGVTPPQVLWKPAELSMWGNDQFGCCCTAEEFFNIACSQPETFLPYHKAVKWARSHWALNGAGLWEILNLMVSEGIYHGDKIYRDGAFTSVDWGNPTILRNAIAQGPVKLGVAADQLENDVWQKSPSNGWVATGITAGDPLDHCVSLCGYGTYAWLAQQLGAKAGAAPAKAVQPNTMVYALFTWSSIGIIDYPSLLAITGEAWLRNPTSLAEPNPDAEAVRPVAAKK